MTIPNNSSAKRITVQIPTASGDALARISHEFSKKVTG